MTERRPFMQLRAMALALRQGGTEAIVVRQWPVQGSRGVYRCTVSTSRMACARFALGTAIS